MGERVTYKRMSLDVSLRHINHCPHCQGELEGEIVYGANITHNLTEMADKAKIYKALWRPEEINITRAKQLIRPLEAGLKKLKGNPAKFEKMNPDNGWGSYDGLVRFVEDYLKACKEYPGATIEISR